MAHTSKGKAPAASTANPGDEGKQSFNQSAPDFIRMVNLMASLGFFDQWGGAKTFYKHPDNKFWFDRYTESSFVNGWATAKKKYMDSLMRNKATGNEDEDACEFFCRLLSSCRLALSCHFVVDRSILILPLTATLFSSSAAGGANPNDMFAVCGVKRPAGAISPCFSNQTPTIGHLDLPADIVIPLQQHEKKIEPGCFASCIQGASMTHAVAILIQPSAGVVGNATAANQDNLTLAHIDTSIQDGPNGECVLRYTEVWAEAFYNFKWKKATIKTQNFANADDWTIANLALENNVNSYQKKDRDAIYGVAQFTLPFKCVKTIKAEDQTSLYDPDTAGFAIQLLLWHADESGRNTTSLKKAAIAVKGE